MDITTIEERARKQLDELDEDNYVSKYRELLELEKNTVKQLATVRKAIEKFKEDPDAYVDSNEDLW